MYPLVESIKIVDGIPLYLKWHQRRYERSYKQYYGSDSKYNISQILSIPDKFSSGVVKGRFCYNANEYKWEFKKYIPDKRETLKIVRDDQIEYNLKLTDRSQLKKLFRKRGECDDILIVKKGYITDTSISNIVFKDSERWITPSTPLLEGTTRARLLQKGKIDEADIKIEDLSQFNKFQLINAMIGFDKEKGEPISSIHL